MPTKAEALDAPVKAEVRAGLDRAQLLPVGKFEATVSAGVNHPFSGGLGAFVRGEVDWHPRESLTAFGFAQADTDGLTAGVGMRFAL